MKANHKKAGFLEGSGIAGMITGILCIVATVPSFIEFGSWTAVLNIMLGIGAVLFISGFFVNNAGVNMSKRVNAPIPYEDLCEGCGNPKNEGSHGYNGGLGGGCV